MSRFEFPVLEGWETVSRVAEVLGVSRQAVHKMLNNDVFGVDGVRQLGNESKPIYIVSSEALTRVLNQRNSV